MSKDKGNFHQQGQSSPLMVGWTNRIFRR